MMGKYFQKICLCFLLLSSASVTAGAQPDPVATHTAVIATTMGNITVELYGADAPETVNNFARLARKKYYNGIAFHRCIPGFVIQGGDPNSRDTAKRALWGQGGQSIYGHEFADELNPDKPSYQRGYVEGTLAMANGGPNTNGSQFFIVTGLKGTKLPKLYTIFGKVTAGMDVAHKIEATGVAGEIPENPARIRSVTIKQNRKIKVITAPVNKKLMNENPDMPAVTETAVISTSMGDITVELYGKDAPKTVANFAGLARKNFYDAILFHRVVPGFVIQAGDPNTKDASHRAMWGTGGESIYGAKFEDELSPVTPSYRQGYVMGTLAMANSGPNTNSSQFFIITGPQGTTLPHLYTIFGKVTAGLDVARKIEGAPADDRGVPNTPVAINSVTVK